ncbi:hypothetical protein BRD00_02750 [Halobacteriales archaeon QS_8_69_26]|nr:MAG: hypothetical protein BRD00_02750 [Halobacteriales archaeon QS_8_69_26]
MTEWNNPRATEYRDAHLSFGVILVDSITGNRLGKTPQFELAELDTDPVRTPSGYWAFTNLGNFDLDTVHLTVDAGREYFTEEREIVLRPDRAEYDPDDPDTVVVEDPTDGVRIDFTPTPAYRFPYTVTHVRGHVNDADGNPVPGATVSVPDFDVSVESVEKGEYAIHVPVEKKNVYKNNGKKLVKLNGHDNGNGANGGRIGSADDYLDDPTMEVHHPDYGSVTEPVEIEAGTRTVHYFTLE